MLNRLHVKGVGTIADAVIDPSPGMTAITGETGAGKSMLLEALSMLGCGRPKRGAAGPSSVVEGVFSAPDGSQVSFLRDMGSRRRGRLVDGRPVTAKGMREAITPLAVIHGQSDQIRLADPASQLALLDSYADDGTLLEGWRRAHAHADDIRVKAGAASDPETLDRIDFLESSTAKAEKAGLREGRLAGLRAEADRIDAITERRSKTLGALESLEEARDLILSAAGAVDDDGLRDMATSLDSVMSGMRGFDDDADDVDDVDVINGRIADIEEIVRRHGGDEAEAIRWLGDAEDELARLKDAVASSQEASDLMPEAERLERGAWDALLAARRRAAVRMGTAINREIGGLSMPGASLSVDVGDDGTASFLFSPYEGAAPRPIGQAASGGELSRLMLAIELVSPQPGGRPVMVFDEVDAGVGGRAAAALGRRLARLSASTQVIVVTHLPQVSAYADIQYAVSRDGGRTEVAAVSGSDRIRETARMLGGDDDDPAGLAHAKSLLGRCRPGAGGGR